MQRMVEKSDLVVIGGGLAGTCAAIAAARVRALRVCFFIAFSNHGL